MEFLKVLRRIETANAAQVIIATHAPILMAYPGARLMRLAKSGLSPVELIDTDHFRLLRSFCDDPVAFIAGALDD
jgi:predicted ATPase